MNHHSLSTDANVGWYSWVKRGKGSSLLGYNNNFWI